MFLIAVVVVDEHKVALLDHIRDAVLYVDPAAPASTVHIDIIGITTPYTSPMAKDNQASDILTTVNAGKCIKCETGAKLNIECNAPTR